MPPVVSPPREYQLASSGDTAQLRYALMHSGSLSSVVNGFSPDNQATLLYNAVASGNLTCVRMLVEEFKADVQQPCTQYSNTPLHLAVHLGMADTVQFLLAHGAVARPNAFGEFPADQLDKRCDTRSAEAAQQTLNVLRQFRGAAMRVFNAPAPSSQTQPQQQQQQLAQHQPLMPQQPPPPVAPPSMLMLPPGCEEVRRMFPEPRLTWSATNADFVARGLLPYIFKGATYYTPVVLLHSKQVVDAASATTMYRCLLDLHNLNGLAVSSRATYVDFLSGALKPVAPFQYASFLEFIKTAVIGQFEKAPPLVDAASSTAVQPGSTVPTERRVLMELSAFCDGALQYRSATHTIEGVVPIFPSNNKAFKMLAAVPVKITLVHLTHGHTTQAPLVFVGPLDSDMKLVATGVVDGNTGQVKGLASLLSWNSRSSLTTLLREMQDAFTSNLPVQAVPASPSIGDMSSSTGAAQTFSNTRGSLGPQSPAVPPSPSGSSASEPSEAMMCVICLSEQKRFIALPCRHLLFCPSCVDAFARQNKKECPICRARISDLFEIYT